ncbi:ead/Ea22-like family protein [Salmonella enterica]|uniref:ead/Ea22-like family protein n=1 Tax=Salmonella enterica TaxID=28901 RepID=UPI002B238254|nr:ead/Ea22-like family protein [Salmonella enterica]MEA9015827.1 ead/Ea22-like family protein [Salmonella enterica subsp. enterica]MEA9144222.1 ead/Ea22-like family protein [Salmonella enterica subsp. enterica]
MNPLTYEKLAEIRQRYSPVAAPKCHICGAEMTIGAMSASRIVYACSGATYDDVGCHYAPGRSIADEHYAQSRVTVVDISDPDVVALLEALEKAQREAIVDWEAAASMNVENQELKQRIADLESRTVKVPYLPDDCDRTEAHFKYQAALAAAGIQFTGD